MGQYKFSRQQKYQRKWAIHPIWRGIGMVWLVLLPIMSYAGAIMLRQEYFKQGWDRRTPEIKNAIEMKDISLPSISALPNLPKVISPQKWINWLPPRGEPKYYADLLFFGGFIFFGFGLTSILYAFLYRSFGPPKDPYESIEVGRPHKRRIG